MVCLGERERLVVKSSMAVAPERTAAKPLHNFDLPCLKWGSQRYLRCVKVNSDGGGRTDRRSIAQRFDSSPIDRRRELEWERRKRQRFFSKPGKIEDEKDDAGEEGIAAVREKLMCDLKKAADKMKYAIFRKEAAAEEGVGDADEDDEDDDDDVAASANGEKSSPASVAVVVEEARPWNLRTRRAACKAPAKGLRIEDRKAVASPLRTEGNNGNGARSPRLVRGIPPEKERVNFSVALEKKEIEEDFMELLGHRPPRRPKKRPRIVQKQLDTLFPGLLLREVTAETYKVPEVPENGRR
ncbi:uncharacterized protein LOC21398538 isoform X2 [Morus notabilis]|uniref:uncharacterized protein LOC21398538 isoform X2 n=1 Tax=Morus notabilis TaxID=981085 RepID=UPI000CED50E2|nr:uncharacterized protein LOC21398538 isoform X2 [Morus notabilis]